MLPATRASLFVGALTTGIVDYLVPDKSLLDWVYPVFLGVVAMLTSAALLDVFRPVAPAPSSSAETTPVPRRPPSRR